MGVVQAKELPLRRTVHFDHVPIDRYEELITRYRLLMNCVKKVRENPNDACLRNKFAVMATQYLDKGHSNINVTQEEAHHQRVKTVVALIEELCPDRDDLPEEQVTARARMLCEVCSLSEYS